MPNQDDSATASDHTLIAQARQGDQAAFAELWRRHYRSGATVARQFTSSIDADDLVSEAYTRIYQRILAGGGPDGAFRPYLYTTIRNLASSWGAAASHVQVDDIQDFEDPSTLDDPAGIALDRTLTARAFRSLPERWQSVLWYTEVEGMDPHEVAPLLGMTANGVAALSYRAREGLRKAWLQAHISDDTASGQCRWTLSRLGDYARHGLTERETERVAAHLAECEKCAIISEEVEEVGSHLAMVMIPLLLGGVAGGTLLATAGHASSAVAASAIPAVPASFQLLAGPTAVAPAVLGGLSMGSAVGTSALIGSFAIVGMLGGGIALGAGQAPTAAAPTSQKSTAQEQSPRPAPSPPPVDPSHVPAATGHADPGDEELVTLDVPQLVSRLGGGGASGGSSGGTRAAVALSLSGTGMPGATVTATVGGVAAATTTVSSGGNWSLPVTVPSGIHSVQLKQRLTLLGVVVPLDVPLSLGGGSLKGISVQLLN